MSAKLKLEWKQKTYNELLQGDSFAISYNRKTGRSAIASACAEILDLPRGGEETALYDETTDTWHILNGDFRKQYEDAFPNGFEACLEVYKKNIKRRSKWSTDCKLQKDTK